MVAAFEKISVSSRGFRGLRMRSPPAPSTSILLNRGECKGSATNQIERQAGNLRRPRPVRGGGSYPSLRWIRGTSTSCPKFVPGSPHPAAL
jgi:hypothetical protein